MAMDEGILAENLTSLAPTAAEATAIQNLVEAYGSYAADAESNGIALSAAGLSLGKAAMAGALAGMSASGAALVQVPAAVLAFWSAVAAGLAASFTGATAITPPPHATLAADFADLMPENTAGDVTLEEAADALAALLHSDATTGGTATFPGPVVAPIL